METIYLGFVIALIVLAVFDLWVGVSNDAVNFLNSAIGAKVASFKTVIIVAAVGIFCGAAMSNGMMEIARHGIFRPEQFYFNELMYIFLAVMVTDIVLLDIFNSLGMPTSTTVSMVFELLGATFTLSLIKIVSDPDGLLTIAQLMNTEKALSVIMGIFISVPIAFFFGALVQFLSRLIFTFNYKTNLKWKIGIFGGIAATSIVYFMLIKGIKDLSFMNPDTKSFIHHNTLMIVTCCFIAFTVIMQLLHALKVNVFKVIVLMGTFALAMAFAGNDLVNFIGVPLAGCSSYADYVANGNGNPAGLLMDSLNSPAKTPVLILVFVGIIMIISLVTSQKAFNVVKTSVNLARQDEGDEMFGSSKMARSIVRSSNSVANFVVRVTPIGVRNWIDRRFNQNDVILEDGAAFDMVRASINLVMAGLLIALGTSLKLPLSTTYVAFMVAMGTSLADKAWGRESAVFRITGVISVIGGWFITAGAAFTLCFLVVLVMYFGGMIVTVALVALAICLLIRSNIKYNKKKKEEEADNIFVTLRKCKEKNQVRSVLFKYVADNQIKYIDRVEALLVQITDAFFNEDLKKLRHANSYLKDSKQDFKKQRRKEMIGMRMLDTDLAIEKNTWFHLAANSTEQMLYCLKRICDPCEEHIDNNFFPLDSERINEFLPIRNKLITLLEDTKEAVSSNNYSSVDALREQCDTLKAEINIIRKKQMNRMNDNHDNLAVSYIFLNMLQEIHEMLTSLRHLLRAARSFQE